MSVNAIKVCNYIFSSLSLYFQIQIMKKINDWSMHQNNIILKGEDASNDHCMYIIRVLTYSKWINIVSNGWKCLTQGKWRIEMSISSKYKHEMYFFLRYDCAFSL